MLLHYLYYIAVETGGPGKILFSRKLGPKIARFPKIALLNDPKNFLSNQNIKCSKSFNSQSYLVKIDFRAPFCNSAYYRGSEASLRKFFDEGTTRSGVGHFLEFGPSSQLDIAYFDKTKWS